MSTTIVVLLSYLALSRAVRDTHALWVKVHGCPCRADRKRRKERRARKNRA